MGFFAGLKSGAKLTEPLFKGGNGLIGGVVGGVVKGGAKLVGKTYNGVSHVAGYAAGAVGLKNPIIFTGAATALTGGTIAVAAMAHHARSGREFDESQVELPPLSTTSLSQGNPMLAEMNGPAQGRAAGEWQARVAQARGQQMSNPAVNPSLSGDSVQSLDGSPNR